MVHPCLLDRAVLLHFRTACAGASHASFSQQKSGQPEEPLVLWAVSGRFPPLRRRFTVGVFGPLSSPTQAPAGRGSPFPEPSETCVTLLGGLWPEPILPKAWPLFLSQHETAAHPPRTTEGSFKHYRPGGLKNPSSPRTEAFQPQTERSCVCFQKREAGGQKKKEPPSAPGEEPAGSEGTFRSLRCIDKLRLPRPRRRPGEQRGLRLLGCGGLQSRLATKRRQEPAPRRRARKEFPGLRRRSREPSKGGPGGGQRW